MSASRKEIIDKADERSPSDDSVEILEASSTITSPSRRTIAEIDWFPGESESTINEINDCIDNNESISITGLNINSQLNAEIFNLQLCDSSNIDCLVDLINSIDVLFEIIDLEELTQAINKDRSVAQIPLVELSGVKEAWNNKRLSIKTLINDKLSALNESTYKRTVYQLVKTVISDDQQTFGVVVDDVVSDYEIRMRPKIEKAELKIRSCLQKIEEAESSPQGNASLNLVIRPLLKWSELSRPLLIKARAEGKIPRDSDEIADDISDVVIEICDEYGYTAELQKLISAVKTAFEEMPELISTLDNDILALQISKKAQTQHKQESPQNNRTAQTQHKQESLQNNKTAQIQPKQEGSEAEGFGWVKYIVIGILIIGLVVGLIGCDSDESYDDYTDEELTEQTMPENGYVFYSGFSYAPSSIAVENPTDYAYYIKFVDSEDNTVVAFFVSPQSNVEIPMGSGDFYLKYTCGTTWYGEDNYFGNTTYCEDDEAWTFSSQAGWTLTLQETATGNLHVEYISAEEF